MEATQLRSSGAAAMHRTSPWLAAAGGAAARAAPARAARRPAAARVAALARSSDLDREKGRSYRRTVFTQHNWRLHRSISRYPRHMDGILTSRIVRGLLPPLGFVLASSCLVCLYEELLTRGALAAAAPAVAWLDVGVSPDGPFGISTFALSLLLVFRTNSSYERWWEACSAWADIVSASTHLARQACQWLPAPGAQEERTRAALARWLAAFPLALMACLREEEGRLPALTHGVLLPEEQALLLRSPAPPLTALSAMGALIAGSRMPLEAKARMDEGVARLQDALQACEKIVRTPLPLSYTRHTSRFLMAWLFFLPFVAWETLGWATVPVDVILGFFLLGIEEIGVQVEEPLGVLALEHWCGVVAERTRQVNEEHAAIQALQRGASSPVPPTPTALAALAGQQQQAQPAAPASVPVGGGGGGGGGMAQPSAGIVGGASNGGSDGGFQAAGAAARAESPASGASGPAGPLRSR